MPDKPTYQELEEKIKQLEEKAAKDSAAAAIQKEYEIQYHVLFDSAHDAIIVMDRNLIIDCNKRALELFRGTKEQVIGHSTTEFWPERQRDGRNTLEHSVEHIKASLRGEKTSQEVTHKRLDGTLVDTDVTLNVFEFKGKKYLQATIRDITEKKAIEEALRQSEERYRTILEDIEDGYYEVDLAGNFTFFNDSMCQIWGYPKKELMGINNRQYTEKENAKKLFQVFNEVYRTGKPAKGFDWQIIRKDGKKRFIEASVSLLKDSSGKQIGFRGVTRDVTERKQMEEEIHQSAERYRTILEEMEDGYFEVDLAGNFLFINDAGCRLLGYSKEELPGTSFRGHLNKEDLNIVYNAFGKIYSTGKPERGISYRAIRKDGTTGFAEIAGFPLQNQKGEIIGFRGIGSDVTERKRTEEKIQYMATHDALT